VASRLGSLSLALRSFAVSDREPASGATAVIEHPLPPVYASEVSRALSPPPSAAPSRNTDIMVYRGSDAPVTSQSPAIDHSAEKAAKAQDAQNAQIAAAENAHIAALNSAAAAANKVANKIPSFGPNKLGY
jgi:pilus assembly protein CpaB